MANDNTLTDPCPRYGSTGTTFTNIFDASFSRSLTTIEKRLIEVAQRFTPFTLIRGDLNEIDTKLEYAQLPVIFILSSEQGACHQRVGQWFDEERVLIGFYDRVRRDAYAEDNAAVFSVMREAAKMFVNEVNKTGYFEYVTDFSYFPDEEQFSSNLSGLTIDLTLKHAEGECLNYLCVNDADA